MTPSANQKSFLKNLIALILFFLPALGFSIDTPVKILNLDPIGFNLSGITYNADSNSYFLVQNNYGFIFEYNSDFSQLLRKIHIKNLKDKDLEDIQYLGNSKFAVVSESNQVLTFRVPSSAIEVDMNQPQFEAQEFQLPRARKKNKGFEGLCYISESDFAGLSNSPTGYFLALQEDNPKKIYAFPWLQGEKKYHYSYSLEYSEPINVNALLKHVMSDLSSCFYDSQSKLIYLLSHESSRIMILNLKGEKIRSIDLPPWSHQYEGITFTPSGDLILVSEPSHIVIVPGVR